MIKKEKLFMGFQRLKDAQRIVIKIGTSSLTHETGKMNLRRIDEMTRIIADIRNAGKEIVLVSSGAIGVGLGKLNIPEKPASIAAKQALAAIGQSSLMAIYEKFFLEYGCQAAQVLLTKSVLEDETSYANIVNAFTMMFTYDVIPIVNENDVIATDEIESGGNFGDNDTLSAYVARFIKADLLVIWTDINGLYDSNPRENPRAKIIPVVNEINDDTYRCASGAGSWRGSGGMQTKLHAAAIVMEAGIDMVITNSKNPQDLYEILNGRQIGTLFTKKED
jgi:glutamate 5-kinase